MAQIEKKCDKQGKTLSLCASNPNKKQRHVEKVKR